MKILGDRLLIKEYTVTEKDEQSGMEFSSDGDTLPRAEVILVSKELESKEDSLDVPKIGDKVYYTRPREKGKIKYNDEEHFAVHISAIVAIL